MKRSFEENIKNKLLKFSKKNRICRYISIICMLFFACLLYFKKYTMKNTKRFLMMNFTFILFASYTSFSFPIFATEEELLQKEENPLLAIEEDVDVELAKEVEVDYKEVVILEDEDVLTFEGEEALLEIDVEDIERFDLNDFLDYQGIRDVENVEKQEAMDGVNVFSKEDWRLILINKQHQVPEDYTFPLGTISKGMQCDERIIDELIEMFQVAKENNIHLLICSPYRDYERQEVLFNRKVKTYINQGLSYMDAYKYASQSVTVPGASEHQIGLAIDVISSTYTSLDIGFGETEAGIWLADNCAEFGFILRYPEGKEYITGIQYEPWHFRYVGVEAATIIMKKKLTLEEFLEDL